MSTSFAYDTVAYPAFAYDYTHPDRLATVAALYGMQPTSLSRCRVLELGGGTGANLMPMAYQWPDSEFVGIDLSSTAIAQGQAAVAAFGLDNIDLRYGDIMEVGAEIGQFDYIIAHGVYSWVPDAVRERIMALCRECLTPQGVAYISYNCRPGSHMRDLARDIMHYHIRAIDDPRQKIEQAKAILKVVADASADNFVYGAVLRDEFRRVSETRTEVIFHDDLSRENTAFLLAEVVAAAERHGLQYLSDTTLSLSDPQHLSEPARKFLERFPASEFIAREQYRDFIDGTGFRRSLFCHGEITLDRALAPACLRRFHLSAEVVAGDSTVDVTPGVVAKFKVTKDATISTDHGLSKAALLRLSQIWPASTTFSDLVEEAFGLLREAAGPLETDSDAEVEALTNVLFQSAMAGHVGLHVFPPKLTAQVSDRPRASRLARQAAATEAMITNLTHGTVFLEDMATRRFLSLVDGTRTVDDLVADLAAALERGVPDDGDSADAEARPDVTQELVERNLEDVGAVGPVGGVSAASGIELGRRPGRPIRW